MDTTQALGIVASIVVLAGLTVVIVNGGSTAQVIGASATGFADVLRAATGQTAAKKK